jgi:uncharacterized protein (TIGR03663 family)
MQMPRLVALGWIALLALGLWLRLHDLEANPIHADEATGARILAQHLEGEGYRFNPQHFHGPILTWLSAPIAHWHQESTWREIRLATLRLSPALAGSLVILMPLLWLRQLGTSGVLTAAAFLATSPLLVYYNRIYIHESWLLLFGMLALAAAYRLLTRPTLLNGILTGCFLGLMFATKETVCISIIAWGTAAALYRIFASDQALPNKEAYIKPFLLLATTALFVSALCYTNFFQTPRGFLDALQTFFVYETTPGHEKPWYYYLHLLLWPKAALGIGWSEACIFLFAMTALGMALPQRHNFSHLAFLALATAGHLVIYSSIDYKTPWLMLLPWAHLCLLAGGIFQASQKYTPVFRSGLALLLVLSLAYQTKQSLHATRAFANDDRNPYAYVPTTRDPQRIADWLLKIQALPEVPEIAPLAVIGKQYWPLPWYLRAFNEVGYWPEPLPEHQRFPVILSMPQQVAQCDAILSESHIKLPRSLRSNVSITLYLRSDLWQTWMEAPTP